MRYEVQVRKLRQGISDLLVKRPLAELPTLDMWRSGFPWRSRSRQVPASRIDRPSRAGCLACRDQGMLTRLVARSMQGCDPSRCWNPRHQGMAGSISGSKPSSTYCLERGSEACIKMGRRIRAGRLEALHAHASGAAAIRGGPIRRGTWSGWRSFAGGPWFARIASSEEFQCPTTPNLVRSAPEEAHPIPPTGRCPVQRGSLRYRGIRRADLHDVPHPSSRPRWLAGRSSIPRQDRVRGNRRDAHAAHRVTGHARPSGDPSPGRVVLLGNADVEMSICMPSRTPWNTTTRTAQETNCSSFIMVQARSLRAWAPSPSARRTTSSFPRA